MKILVDYDHAAWPVGGHYALDDSTYDGAPDSHCPLGWGKTPDAAIEELAAQWASSKGYEDFTLADLEREAAAATARGDENTLKFINHLRAFV